MGAQLRIGRTRRAMIEVEIEDLLTRATTLIHRLDSYDGDPDLEEDDHDEEDDWPGDLYSEDAFDLPWWRASGPGCPLSDPGGASQYDDEGADDGE